MLFQLAVLATGLSKTTVRTMGLWIPCRLRSATNSSTASTLPIAITLCTGSARLHPPQDWSTSWRRPTCDAKATGFNAPETWPKDLPQNWKATRGLRAPTPVLIADQLCVFGRQAVRPTTASTQPLERSLGWKSRKPGRGGAAFGAEVKVVMLGRRGALFRPETPLSDLNPAPRAPADEAKKPGRERPRFPCDELKR